MEMNYWLVSFFAKDGLLFSVQVECSEFNAIRGAHAIMSPAQRRIKAAECIGIKVEAF